MNKQSEHVYEKNLWADIYALGMSLGLFLAITFSICVGFGLAFPNVTMYQSWLPLLPWVNWMDIPSFFLGLIETFAYGWYIALVFVPIFNFFQNRRLK